MFKNWSNRDWVWLVTILCGIIIAIISKRLVAIDEGNILNYISFAATGVSIALALVAIGMAITYNTSSNELYVRMSSTIERMDEKLIGMKDNIEKINNMKPYSKTSEDKGGATNSGNYKLTRIHGIISTGKQWSGELFLAQLDKNLKKINETYKVIDYTINDQIRSHLIPDANK
jgi:hypothetical protein